MHRPKALTGKRIASGALIAALVLAFTVGATAPADTREVGLVDGLWVMRQAEGRYKGPDRSEQLKISVFREHRPDKKRILSVLWLEKDCGRGEDKIVVHFESPSDLTGTNLLLHTLPFKDDDRWLYFPTEKIFRRIRARDKNSNFMGTDFTYEDLADREPAEENHKFLRIEEVDGVFCYVVESTPKDLRSACYSKTVTWVEKNHFVKTRIEYWDLGGRHLKSYTASNLVEVDGAWFPTRLVMRTDRSTQNTVVERSGIRIGLGLKESIFEPHMLAEFPYQDLVPAAAGPRTKS